MSHTKIIVLSYHGWEIQPEYLANDVMTLRKKGWLELSFSELENILIGRIRRQGLFFHVTSDDGTMKDRQFVATLRALSCPCTLFISLSRMMGEEKNLYHEFLGTDDVQVEDHSLRHDRIFHYRHVIGFHSDNQPIISSPERLGLQVGDPICLYGGALVRPRFTPNQSVVDLCRSSVKKISEPQGSVLWTQAMAVQLVKSEMGFYRFGKLCIDGVYESHHTFCQRVEGELQDGRECFREFAGRYPCAFAFPWWQRGMMAEKCLRHLGYQMIFSGNGVCDQSNPFQIPRIFIHNNTPRPLNLESLMAAQHLHPLSLLKDFARRIVYT